MVNKINQIVILDNGAHTIKAGLNHDKTPKVIPNCVTKVKSERRRPFIGDQLEECKDYSGLFYILPFTKGYLINWDVQRQVWDYLFRTKLKLPSDNKHRFSEVGLIITEPVYNFRPIRENMIEILFEDYGFGAILICSAPQLATFNYCFEENKKTISDLKDAKTNSLNAGKTTKEIACLVVDSGFSFTHVVPFVEGHKLLSHSKRIDIGGKALTNHLKDIISYRQLNVLDETYVVNQMKEDCCYVSNTFWKDLEISRQRGSLNTITCDYVLPDYVQSKRGYVVHNKELHKKLNNSSEHEHQIIRMNNERFQVPELLFNPGDVNIDQIGISHTIIHSVSEFNPNFNLNSNANSLDSSAAPSLVRERPDNLRDIDSEEDESELDEEASDKPESKETVNSISKMNGNGIAKEDDQDIDLAVYNDENVQSHLYNNILLIGGNCSFPHFRERVENDIRSNVADILNIRVKLPEGPSTYAWQGGRLLCNVNESGDNITNPNDSLFHKYAVFRKEYLEKGLIYCNNKLTNIQLPTFSSSST